MKKNIFRLVIILVFAGCSSPEKKPSAHRIQGTWTNTSVSEGKIYEFIASFKENGSYDGFLNGKVLVSGGNYTVSGDTIAFRDPICNIDYTGTYRLQFFYDSVRFLLIADSCTTRREGTNGFGFKRKRG